MKKILKSLLALAVLFFAGCGGGGSDGSDGGTYDPAAPSTASSLSKAELSDYISETRCSYDASPRLMRLESPLAIYAGGNAELETAIDRFRLLSGGLVDFVEVATPQELTAYPLGFAVSEGTATNGDGSPGCGSVTSATTGSVYAGNFAGTVTIHLGSAACDDAAAGWFPSAVAEHELGHAVLRGGLSPHVGNFNGDEGLSGDLLSIVLTTYANGPYTYCDQLGVVLAEERETALACGAGYVFDPAATACVADGSGGP